RPERVLDPVPHARRSRADLPRQTLDKIYDLGEPVDDPVPGLAGPCPHLIRNALPEAEAALDLVKQPPGAGRDGVERRHGDVLPPPLDSAGDNIERFLDPVPRGFDGVLPQPRRRGADGPERGLDDIAERL